jgi:type VI secretion system protein ImpF
MPTLIPKERLQPALLDRLTDDEPTRQVEAGSKRVISPAELRAAVVRDLGWLLNTVNLGSVMDLSPYPAVSKSVLNYGLGGMAGRPRSGLLSTELEQRVRTAIECFEPRILARSLKISVVVDLKGMGGNAVRMEISGLLWQHPLPEEFRLQTDLDLDTGYVSIKERSEG